MAVTVFLAMLSVLYDELGFVKERFELTFEVAVDSVKSSLPRESLIEEFRGKVVFRVHEELRKAPIEVVTQVNSSGRYAVKDCLIMQPRLPGKRRSSHVNLLQFQKLEKF